MNVRYVINRFNQMKHDYLGETSCFKTILLWIDYIVALLLHGASISDYFAYGFYKLRFNGRQEYITYRRYHKILWKCNDKNDIEICRDKMKFNDYFSDMLGREWLDMTKAKYDEFESFVGRHQVFFLKDVSSYRGIGVKRYKVEDIDKESFYKELIRQDKVSYIIEEAIEEIGCLRDFHPWSVNTIRVVTLYDTTANKVHIMNARIRMGNDKNNVDNFHFHGIGANIDIDSGIIDTKGYDVRNKLYVCHPLTDKQIVGFQIPFWNDCLAFVRKAAMRIPSVRYIGWDVVVKPNGTFVLIEANDNADHDFQQLYNKGLWKEYKKIIKTF